MSDKKNILFIGRGTIAINCLESLLEIGQLPKIIICDSNDNGKDTWTKSLYKRALELGFEPEKNLFKERRVNKPEFINKIKKTADSLDIIFSIQPYALFRMPFITLAKDHVINLHMAPLPKLRGVAPISWAFLDNLKEMGVTLHLIEDEGIDNGPILAQVKFPIEESDNAWTLFNKCVDEGTALFKKEIMNIINNTIHPVAQDESIATYHPTDEIDFSQLEVDLTKDSTTVYNFVRSRIFPVFQLPYFIYQGHKVEIVNITKIPEVFYDKITVKDGKYFIPFREETLVISPNNNV